jgi:hypothetical protein
MLVTVEHSITGTVDPGLPPAARVSHADRADRSRQRAGRPQLTLHAIGLSRSAQLSYWDGLVLAAAARGGSAPARDTGVPSLLSFVIGGTNLHNDRTQRSMASFVG